MQEHGPRWKSKLSSAIDARVESLISLVLYSSLRLFAIILPCLVLRCLLFCVDRGVSYISYLVDPYQRNHILQVFAMRSPGTDDGLMEPSVKSKSSLRSYTSMFKRRMAKKTEMNSRLKLARETTQEYYQADNASLLPPPSELGVVSSARRSRYRVRRDIQSHIPDWIDDVVHAQLVQIAQRLGEEETNEDGGDGWAPPRTSDPVGRTDSPTEDVPEECLGEVQEQPSGEVRGGARPGSAPETSRDDIHREAQDIAMPRRSSVSAPSTRSLSILRGARSLVSPIDDYVIGPITFHDLDAVHEATIEEGQSTKGQHNRRSRNLSSASGNSVLSQETATSNYSKLSSVTSPGTSADKRISDTLSTRMTWKDIAKKNPIKKPVEAGMMKKVNTHLAKPSTTYSIMSPVNAGVFDDSASHQSKSSASYSVRSPTQPGVLEDESSNRNKPLPPDPKQKAAERRTTFFVVGDIVHSPRTPQSPRLPRSSTYPQAVGMSQSPQITQSPKSPKVRQSPQVRQNPKSSRSPKLPRSAQLPRERKEELPEGMTHRQFARLSRPFSEPVFDFADMPPSPGLEQEVESPALMTPELNEKFLVIEEESSSEEREAELAHVSKSFVPPEPVGDVSATQQIRAESTIFESQPAIQEPAVDERRLSTIAETTSPTTEPTEAEALGLGISGLEDMPIETPSDHAQAQSDLPVRNSSALSQASLSVSPECSTTPLGSRSNSPVPVQQIVILPPSRPTTPQAALPVAVEAVQAAEPVERVEQVEPVALADEVLDSAPLEDEIMIVNDLDEETHDVHSPTPEDEDEDLDEGEYSEDDSSAPPSPTLSQAENDLIAQLDLDTSVKFIRPTSWLASEMADSPTLGCGIPMIHLEEEVRPATALGNEMSVDEGMMPPVEEVRPATALGNEMAREGAKVRKKTESHYEFLWSPDNGWYVA